jgi:hypothetical protein
MIIQDKGVQKMQPTANPLVIGVGTHSVAFSPENRGNFLHSVAARKLLGETEVHLPSAKLWDDAQVELAQSFSHIVVVMANAIRVNSTDAPPWHEVLLANLERTQSPTVVMGLGAQAPSVDSKIDQIPDLTLRLLKVLEERSIEIAVRGTFTARVLDEMGIKNALPVGCQSTFLNGAQFPHALTRTPHPKKVLFNYSRAPLEAEMLEWGVQSDFTLIGQTELWEEYAAANRKHQTTRLNPVFEKTTLTEQSYAEYCRSNFHQYKNMDDWFAGIRGYDFCFGTRFHGNMAAFQSGIPSLWLRHDSRTQELCEQLHLPSISLEQAMSDLRIEALVEAADATDFQQNYSKLFANFQAYIQRAGLTLKV